MVFHGREVRGKLSRYQAKQITRGTVGGYFRETSAETVRGMQPPERDG